MRRKRKSRVPASNLRASLGERIRSREDSSSLDWESEFKVQRPSLPVLLFSWMHRHLKLKIVVAVAVVFLGALLQYAALPRTRPLLEGLRYVSGKNVDLRAVAQKYVPVIKQAWPGDRLPKLGPASLQGRPELLPFDGQLIGNYGIRIPSGSGREEMHYGIDLAAPGGTAVKAVLAGRVDEIFAGVEPNGLLLEHDSGWQTIYRGLEGVAVAPGELVQEGQILGVLGRVSPSRYFELRYRGYPVEPPAGWVDQFGEG